MNSEKDLLKQDLSNQEKPEEIKKFIEDAELLGHEDIAELGRKKLQEILEKADSIEKTSETQIAQVESMGGTRAEVSERTKEVDQKIEEVKTQTQEKITEVKNENKEEVSTETQEKNTEIQSKSELKNEIPSSVKDVEDFLANRETYGKDLKGYEQLNNFIQQRYPELIPKSPEYETKRKELVLVSGFVQIKKHPFVLEKYPNLSLDEYENTKPEIVLGITKYNINERLVKDIEEIKKTKEENDQKIFLGGKYGHQHLAEITPEFIEQNPDIKKGVLDSINRTGMNEFFNNNNAGDQIKILLEKGLISEQDLITTLKNKISEVASISEKEDSGRRFEGQYWKNSRNYFLGKIPTEVLERLIKSDKSFLEEIKMAADSNEKDANQIIDNARIDDHIWLKNNEWYLLSSTSKALRYKKVIGSYDYEIISRKYSQIVNNSLNSMLNNEYENKLLSSALSNKETVPMFLETNVLSKEKILNLYNASLEKEGKLNDSTVDFRLKEIKGLVKLGILNGEEAITLSNKYIEKLDLSKL